MDVSFIAEWAEYEARNRRASIEYARTPSIVAEIIDSLETVGLNKTARAFNTLPAALFAWFPDLIERNDGGDRFSMREVVA